MLGRVTLHAEAVGRVTKGTSATICVLNAEQALHVRGALVALRALTEVVKGTGPLFVALSALDGGFSEATCHGGEGDEEEDLRAHDVVCIRERRNGQA
jgi:hypothetical protein